MAPRRPYTRALVSCERPPSVSRNNDAGTAAARAAARCATTGGSLTTRRVTRGAARMLWMRRRRRQQRSPRSPRRRRSRARRSGCATMMMMRARTTKYFSWCHYVVRVRLCDGARTRVLGTGFLTDFARRATSCGHQSHSTPRNLVQGCLARTSITNQTPLRLFCESRSSYIGPTPNDMLCKFPCGDDWTDCLRAPGIAVKLAADGRGRVRYVPAFPRPGNSSILGRARTRGQAQGNLPLKR